MISTCPHKRSNKLWSTLFLTANTDQLEELEKVDIGVESVFDDLQPLRGQDAHGVANSVESSTAGEDEKPLQEVQAAGDVL